MIDLSEQVLYLQWVPGNIPPNVNMKLMDYVAWKEWKKYSEAADTFKNKNILFEFQPLTPPLRYFLRASLVTVFLLQC